jgi:hypothetical protein
VLKDSFNLKKEGDLIMRNMTRKQKNLTRYARMVLEVLNDYFDHFGKNSAFPSQETMLEQLARKFGYIIKIRQLNYILAFLEAQSIIKRYKRHKKCPIRGFIFRSTRYFIGITGWRLAAMFKITSWGEAHKMINAIKAGAQAKINRTKEYFAPDWMKEFDPFLSKDITVPDG